MNNIHDILSSEYRHQEEEEYLSWTAMSHSGEGFRWATKVEAVAAASFALHSSTNPS